MNIFYKIVSRTKQNKNKNEVENVLGLVQVFEGGEITDILILWHSKFNFVFLTSTKKFLNFNI